MHKGLEGATLTRQVFLLISFFKEEKTQSKLLLKRLRVVLLKHKDISGLPFGFPLYAIQRGTSI